MNYIIWVNTTFKMMAGDERCFLAWTKSLQNLAKVPSITIANHLKGCGKRLQILHGNYIPDVFVKEEDGWGGTCEVKGSCYRSQKKNETPHTVKLKIAEREGRGNVEGAECSCKAGWIEPLNNTAASYNSIIMQVIKVTFHRSRLYIPLLHQ